MAIASVNPATGMNPAEFPAHTEKVETQVNEALDALIDSATGPSMIVRGKMGATAGILDRENEAVAHDVDG
ncbi:hypothetical protein [Rhodococcoides fascians]|uniref:hypothetical protein n=1 Tax=Rhodococcoides fascians TaxID=1828 RepID=UPI0012D31512|nr:hypothetical protein [Rhodococcus fascians]